MNSNLATQAFRRHRGPVTCAAGVPGTELAVTSGYDGAVAVFPLDGGDVQLLGYHDHLVNRVSVSPDGHWAASCSSDFDIIIWDLAKRCRHRVLRGHSDDVEDFCFIDEHTGASVSRDWRVLVWNLDTGAIIRSLVGHKKDVLSVAAIDSQLFTSSDDMTLRVWDVNKGLLRTWGPFHTESDTCAVDAQRKRVVLGCDDGQIRIFDTETGDMVHVINAHDVGIKKVACSPAGGDILSAAYDQKILIWDGDDFSLKVSLDNHRAKWERSFNFSPDGRRVLAGTFDGTVVEWNAATGALLREVGDQSDRPGNDCFNDVACGANGRLAVVSDEGRIRLGVLTADRAAWADTVEPASGRMLMNAITVDERAETLVAGAHDQRLHIHPWNLGEVGPGREVSLNEGPINCVRVCHVPDWQGMIFAACYTGAIVRVRPDGSIAGKFRVHENAVKALRIHATRPVGVSGSADGVLSSWTLDGELIRHFPGHVAIIDDVDLSPCGRYLASTGRDFTVKVYDLDTGVLRHSIELGRRSPKGICFVAEDAVIVTTYWGELIRVDLAEERLHSRQIARNGISSIARCGDEPHVVASSYDGALFLVDPISLDVVNVLRGMVQRVDGAPWAS